MNSHFFTEGLPKRLQIMAESWFSFVESRLSRFRAGSELSALNRAEGRPFAASPLLYEVVTEADRYYRQTEGLFNPYLGERLRMLGYAESFESLSIAPLEEPGNSFAPPAVANCPARLQPDTRSITLAPGVSVDLGGIAKGWSAHRFSLELNRLGVRTGAIGAGGDIALWGSPEGGWEIGIADPMRADQDVCILRLQGTIGIATSSTMKRRWQDSSGRFRNHIIDPRSGLSLESDLLQATVFAPGLVDAEVYAKCVLILGADSGMQWLADRHPDCAAAAVLADGSLIMSTNLKPYIMEGA